MSQVVGATEKKDACRFWIHVYLMVTSLLDGVDMMQFSIIALLMHSSGAGEGTLTREVLVKKGICNF